MVEPIDLTAVDVEAVHPSLTREACLRSMHLVRSDGRVFAGYDAVLVPGAVDAAVLAAGAGRVAARRWPGPAAAFTIESRPRARATSPAPTTSAASIPPAPRARRMR